MGLKMAQTSPMSLWSTVDVNPHISETLFLFDRPSNGNMQLSNVRTTALNFATWIDAVQWEIFCLPSTTELELIANAYGEATDQLMSPVQSAAFLAHSGFLSFDFVQTRVDIAPTSTAMTLSSWGISGRAVFAKSFALNQERQNSFAPSRGYTELPKILFSHAATPAAVQKCQLRVLLQGWTEIYGL